MLDAELPDRSADMPDRATYPGSSIENPRRDAAEARINAFLEGATVGSPALLALSDRNTALAIWEKLTRVEGQQAEDLRLDDAMLRETTRRRRDEVPGYEEAYTTAGNLISELAEAHRLTLTQNLRFAHAEIRTHQTVDNKIRKARR